MPDASQLLADQAVVFSDFPAEDLAITGDRAGTYRALVLQWREGNTVDEGGYFSNIVGKLAIERSTVETMPVRGNSATFRGATYRVGEVDSADEGASVTIDLEEATSAT